MKIENPMKTEDLLMGELKNEIIKSIIRYARKNNIKREGIELDIKITNNNAYETEVITRIKRNEVSQREKIKERR